MFGNRDYEPDAGVFGVVEEIKKNRKQKTENNNKEEISRLSGDMRATRNARNDKSNLGNILIEFVEVKPNEDVPFEGRDKVVIMDMVMGIDEVTVFSEADLEKLELAPRMSAHEFDLGFQLRYLRKLGKIGEVRIVGLPVEKKVSVDQVMKVIGEVLE